MWAWRKRTDGLIWDCGHWWPDDGESRARRQRRIAAASVAAERIAREVRVTLRRDCRVCLQAGGHVGLWPEALAQYFETVYTYEPHAANFACLMRNVAAPHVYATRGVLHERPGGVQITRDIPRSGRWRVSGGGPIPSYRVDDLALAWLDALVLDIEGSELAALRGATDTIARCRPVIVLEALYETGACEWLMRTHEYESAEPFLGRDVVLRPRLEPRWMTA